MANQEHLRIFNGGKKVWNEWRIQNPSVPPDLSKADLSSSDPLEALNLKKTKIRISNDRLGEKKLIGRDLQRWNFKMTCLRGANLSGSNLQRANLQDANLDGASLIEADLYEADITDADLQNADLRMANLMKSKLCGAKLMRADLYRANLWRADLEDADLFQADLSSTNLNRSNFTRAKLTGANLKYTRLVGTNLTDADLTGCSIYGISAWDVNLSGAIQSNLIITESDANTITVDNLEIAQFIYLLLNNENIRGIIDTITSKVVLILGRFTPDRKAVLDSIREELRKRNYLPIMFDFDKPAARDITETISTLAHMARFVIADITDARSIPQELSTIIPALPSVPIQPLLQASSTEYGMFEHFKRFPWVLDTYLYETPEKLIMSLVANVIAPAEEKIAKDKKV